MIFFRCTFLFSICLVMGACGRGEKGDPLGPQIHSPSPFVDNKDSSPPAKPSPALVKPGDLDPSFGTNGKVTFEKAERNPNMVLPSPDGGLFVNAFRDKYSVPSTLKLTEAGHKDLKFGKEGILRWLCYYDQESYFDVYQDFTGRLSGSLICRHGGNQTGDGWEISSSPADGSSSERWVKFDSHGGQDISPRGIYKLPNGEHLRVAEETHDRACTSMGAWTGCGYHSLLLAKIGPSGANRAEFFPHKEAPDTSLEYSIATSPVSGMTAISVSRLPSDFYKISIGDKLEHFATNCPNACDLDVKSFISFEKEPGFKIIDFIFDSTGRYLLVHLSNDTRTFVARYDLNGHLDTHFGEQGKVEIPGRANLHSSVYQADGRLLLATSVGSLRLTPEGRLDEAYGDHGRTLLVKHIQNDGKLIGEPDYLSFSDICRYDSNGKLDLSFGMNGCVNYPGVDVILDAKDRIVLINHLSDKQLILRRLVK